MLAYKFLDVHGRAPFTGQPWRPGEWIEAETAEMCRRGVHACRPADLARWLAAALWEVELDGDVDESRHKVVARRGRLVRSIDGYPVAAQALAEVGAWRCRDRAVDALRRAGDGELAGALASAGTLGDMAALSERVDDATFAGAVAALAVDAAYFALHGNPAQSPFVAACSAGLVAAGPDGDQAAYDGGYAGERAFQSRWLAERLELG